MLKVSVISFSYKRGLPADPTGNGGGFVFDCRAMPNPFWDGNLRGYTGCDKQVADYFARFPETVEPFIDAIEKLIRQSIEQYKRDCRGHLQVAFGCTGGQHRSVYFAEHIAADLNNTPDVEVSVTHTASPYWKTIAKELT